jgi:O-antigen/teichoic acid export membrane protein
MGLAGSPQATIPRADGLHSEARIVAVLTHLGAAQVVLASTAVVRNKIVALRLGPSAFGEFSQLAMVMGVVFTVVSFGMGVALRRNVARATTAEERGRQLASANGMVLGLAAIAAATVAALLASGKLLRLAALEPHRGTALAAAVLVVAIPVEGLRNNYLAFLQGVLDVRGLAVRRSLAVLAATAVAAPIVWFFGFVGAAIQFLVLGVTMAVLLGSRCRALGYAPLRIRLDRPACARLAAFGLASLGSGFAQSLADTAVRTSLIASAGSARNGVLQAAYALSVTLKGVVLASIGTVSLAAIGARTERREVSEAMDRLLGVVIPLGATALGVLGLLGVPVLTLLYSDAFASGAELLPFLLTGDLLVAFVWVVGAPLLAHGDRVLWLALDVGFAVTRWGVAVALLPRLGSVAVVIGYLSGAALHLSLNLAVCRFRYKLALAPRRVGGLALAVGLVASLAVLGARRPPSLWLLGAGVAAWAVYAVRVARLPALLASVARRRG